VGEQERGKGGSLFGERAGESVSTAVMVGAGGMLTLRKGERGKKGSSLMTCSLVEGMKKEGKGGGPCPSKIVRQRRDGGKGCIANEGGFWRLFRGKGEEGKFASSGGKNRSLEKIKRKKR